MEKALWFSHHRPTEEQSSQIIRGSLEIPPYDLIEIKKGMLLGKKDIHDDVDALLSIIELAWLARKKNVRAVFGSFPVPILKEIIEGGETGCWGIPCYAEWGVNQFKESEKPSFKHYKWVLMGKL